MSTIYLKSAYGKPSPGIFEAVTRGEAVIVEQSDLTAEILAAHGGLITGQQLDQDAMLALKPALAAFLDRGGRWFFNGHMVRPLIDGMAQYRPIAAPKRADFDLATVNPHPIYDGIDLKKLETNKGVAGFYGRGCNPLPEGAVAVNGLGAARVPVDWVWARPNGGRIFSHSGNDLAGMGLEWGLAPELSARILAWTNGGPCFDPWPANPAKPAEVLPLSEPEAYGGHRTSTRSGRRIVAPSSGTYYNIRSLEGPRYTHAFDVICRPEQLGDVLRPDDILWVPCRTPAQRMIAQKQIVARHLDAGGTVVALGESRSDLWLPAVDFTETETNWWWWLDPSADLGVRASEAAAKHPLMQDIGDKEVTWHLHGWFVPPEGATVLARDGEGRPILYEDKVSTPGTMIVSSLDPMFHHGSHFMPATTRFLDRFVPNLKAFAHV
ncbi:hypothetical protein C0075_17035 [Rhizobium sp. KAs_5_22]|uniref:hypothetical protein n=1 Tax=Ciceribacter selenitireducens TaxID=448181 RepID=UPI00048A9991|nr:hypothetical protein [Ciceribacter selenitireducens]PPJ47279.1 hypothetical protein C0075_17035 [Rhizobium sp. KAs_5_22]